MFTIEAAVPKVVLKNPSVLMTVLSLNQFTMFANWPLMKALSYRSNLAEIVQLRPHLTQTDLCSYVTSRLPPVLSRHNYSWYRHVTTTADIILHSNQTYKQNRKKLWNYDLWHMPEFFCFSLFLLFKLWKVLHCAMMKWGSTPSLAARWVRDLSHFWNSEQSPDLPCFL